MMGYALLVNIFCCVFSFPAVLSRLFWVYVFICSWDSVHVCANGSLSQAESQHTWCALTDTEHEILNVHGSEQPKSFSLKIGVFFGPAECPTFFVGFLLIVWAVLVFNWKMLAFLLCNTATMKWLNYLADKIADWQWVKTSALSMILHSEYWYKKEPCCSHKAAWTWPSQFQILPLVFTCLIAVSLFDWSRGNTKRGSDVMEVRRPVYVCACGMICLWDLVWHAASACACSWCG